MSHLRKYIFLIDGLGALATAFTTGVILPIFNIGLSQEILTALASLALLFSLYSLSCHFLKKSTKWLIPIILANSLYCLSTLVITLLYFQKLSLLAIIYFPFEIGVVAGVVALEIKIFRSYRQ